MKISHLPFSPVSISGEVEGWSHRTDSLKRKASVELLETLKAAQMKQLLDDGKEPFKSLMETH